VPVVFQPVLQSRKLTYRCMTRELPAHDPDLQAMRLLNCARGYFANGRFEGVQVPPCGTFNSSTMMVMMIARTPSLKASSRVLLMDLRSRLLGRCVCMLTRCACTTRRATAAISSGSPCKDARSNMIPIPILGFTGSCSGLSTSGLYSVTNIKAGDCVLFDTALFHGAYAAEDPTGESGNGENQLLRATYILGMPFSQLQTPQILQARRTAYELDLFWPPTIGHAAFARHILAGKLDRQNPPSLREAAEGTLEKALQLNLADRQHTRGEVFPRIREFARAEPEVQRLIDPTHAAKR